jgi:hypothetical protein
MQGGEIFVPKIPSMNIVDLARAIAPEWSRTGANGKKNWASQAGLPKFHGRWNGGRTRRDVYQATDQRFLGDEDFVERVASRAGEKEIELRGNRRVGFERLLQAVAKEYGVSKRALTGTGRQREWIEGRRPGLRGAGMGKITTKELGKRLGRDPSMISRLSRECEEGGWDRQTERRLAHALEL